MISGMAASLASLSLLVGCVGSIEGGAPESEDGTSGPGGKNPSDTSALCDSADEGCESAVPGAVAGEAPAPLSRFARLTHREWQNSVRDLLALDDLEDFSGTFRSDPSQQGYLFDNDANSLLVDEALWQAYQRAATQIAAYVVEDPARLEVIAPEAEDDQARTEQFIQTLGARAHRRPLTDQQIEVYQDLHALGPEFFPELSDFEAGAQLVLEAMLQSPYFLYRVEMSDEIQGGLIKLDSFEVASRLSYTLWDTMPDEELFEAAVSDELLDADKVAEHARRMLEDERAAPVLSSFHHQLFELERYQNILNEPSGLPELAEEENHRFVEHIVFETEGSLTDLLTSTETYANATLAELYGLEGDFSDEFELVQLDAEERRGLLTQIGFLASNANSGVPDPIHRGVFLSRRLGCVEIPVPPGEIPPLPAADGRTNRETVEAHTEKEGTTCIACHGTFINPFGFPFEYYDGLGRYRTEDNGQPVDGETEPTIGDEVFEVSNGIELADAFASSLQVHECYASHWLQFAFGRNAADEDEPLVARLGLSSKDAGMSVQALIVELVSSQPFLTRSTEDAK